MTYLQNQSMTQEPPHYTTSRPENYPVEPDEFDSESDSSRQLHTPQDERIVAQRSAMAAHTGASSRIPVGNRSYGGSIPKLEEHDGTSGSDETSSCSSRRDPGMNHADGGNYQERTTSGGSRMIPDGDSGSDSSDYSGRRSEGLEDRSFQSGRGEERIMYASQHIDDSGTESDGDITRHGADSKYTSRSGYPMDRDGDSGSDSDYSGRRSATSSQSGRGAERNEYTTRHVADHETESDKDNKYGAGGSRSTSRNGHGLDYVCESDYSSGSSSRRSDYSERLMRQTRYEDDETDSSSSSSDGDSYVEGSRYAADDPSSESQSQSSSSKDSWSSDDLGFEKELGASLVRDPRHQAPGDLSHQRPMLTRSSSYREGSVGSWNQSMQQSVAVSTNGRMTHNQGRRTMARTNSLPATSSHSAEAFVHGGPRISRVGSCRASNQSENLPANSCHSLEELPGRGRPTQTRAAPCPAGITGWSHHQRGIPVTSSHSHDGMPGRHQSYYGNATMSSKDGASSAVSRRADPDGGRWLAKEISRRSFEGVDNHSTHSIDPPARDQDGILDESSSESSSGSSFGNDCDSSFGVQEDGESTVEGDHEYRVEVQMNEINSFPHDDESLSYESPNETSRGGDASISGSLDDRESGGSGPPNQESAQPGRQQLSSQSRPDSTLDAPVSAITNDSPASKDDTLGTSRREASDARKNTLYLLEGRPGVQRTSSAEPLRPAQHRTTSSSLSTSAKGSHSYHVRAGAASFGDFGCYPEYNESEEGGVDLSGEGGGVHEKHSVNSATRVHPFIPPAPKQSGRAGAKDPDVAPRLEPSEGPQNEKEPPEQPEQATTAAKARRDPEGKAEETSGCAVHPTSLQKDIEDDESSLFIPELKPRGLAICRSGNDPVEVIALASVEHPQTGKAVEVIEADPNSESNETGSCYENSSGPSSEQLRTLRPTEVSQQTGVGVGGNQSETSGCAVHPISLQKDTKDDESSLFIPEMKLQALTISRSGDDPVEVIAFASVEQPQTGKVVEVIQADPNSESNETGSCYENSSGPSSEQLRTLRPTEVSQQTGVGIGGNQFESKSYQGSEAKSDDTSLHGAINSSAIPNIPVSKCSSLVIKQKDTNTTAQPQEKSESGRDSEEPTKKRSGFKNPSAGSNKNKRTSLPGVASISKEGESSSRNTSVRVKEDPSKTSTHSTKKRRTFGARFRGLLKGLTKEEKGGGEDKTLEKKQEFPEVGFSEPFPKRKSKKKHVDANDEDGKRKSKLESKPSKRESKTEAKSGGGGEKKHQDWEKDDGKPAKRKSSKKGDDGKPAKRKSNKKGEVMNKTSKKQRSSQKLGVGDFEEEKSTKKPKSNKLLKENGADKQKLKKPKSSSHSKESKRKSSSLDEKEGKRKSISHEKGGEGKSISPEMELKRKSSSKRPSTRCETKQRRSKKEGEEETAPKKKKRASEVRSKSGSNLVLPKGSLQDNTKSGKPADCHETPPTLARAGLALES